MLGAAVCQLVEREEELARLDEILSSAGRLAVVEGEAGIGKTSLMAAVLDRKRSRGVPVFAARGGELERDLPFGVVRQVFEGAPVSGDGPARIASEFLREGATAAPESVLVASFFSLASQLASPTQPTVIAVDDVQWADRASLRWLLFVARRLEGSSLSLLLGLRTGEGEEEELDRLLAEPVAESMRLRPLTEAGVATLADDAVEGRASPEFCAAVHEATAGNPFYARELLGAARADGIPGSPEGAERVRGLGPRTAGRAILLRLGRLGEPAQQLARAVAILGTHSELRLAAALAGLDAEDAAAAADRLAFAGILDAGRPLDFVHPIVREVVRQEMPVAETARSHRRAAELLSNAGAPLEEVAVHLMATEPMADPWVADTLHQAGVTAPARDAGMRFLARALAEPPPRETHDRVVFDLARLEQLIDPVRASSRFRGLLEGCRDPVDLMRIVEGMRWARSASDGQLKSDTEIAEAVARFGAAEHVSPAVDFLLEMLGERRPEVLERHVTAALAGDTTELPPEVLADMGVLAPVLGLGRDSAIRLSQLALADGSLRDDRRRVSYPMGFVQALASLILHDRLEQADAELGAFVSGSSARSAADALLGHLLLAWLRLAQGKVTEAERLARANRDTALAFEHAWFALLASYWLVDALVERGKLDEAQSVVDELDLKAYEGWNRDNVFGARGRLRFAQGRFEEALEDFEQAIAAEAESLRGGSCYSPIAGAALAALAAGHHEPARELVARDLEDARARELPRGVGVALRVSGLVENDVGALEESVAVLEQSPAQLELARSLIELGAALRRRNDRAASREPLRRGLEIAQTCGADALAERALVELRATGARPRSVLLTGVDALTPSERRVAELAARGHTNREIAGQLFLSPKTVERHLGETYRKLDIASRDELPVALAGEASAT